IYPIPAKDFIKVNLQLPPNASGVEVGLYDAVGKKLWVKAVGQNASEISIPVNTVSGGLYLLKISLPGGQPEIHKIIVQKN
ncbi:MAG TPA: T9SS type A sorting domain-containing protein, partial [Ferruginibacter sp.]|nr:T9SS type A sorting domain-containing protein [Ferruginibacter sp.]